MSLVIQEIKRGETEILRQLDRSEQIEYFYFFEEDKLVKRVSTESESWCPGFSPEDDHPYSLKKVVDRANCTLDEGGILWGVFEDGRYAGHALLGNVFRNGTLQLVDLQVSRAFRRRGVATMLFRQAADVAKQRGAQGMYISATPSASAVGFYLRMGAKILDTPDPELFAEEPEDIHLVLPL